MANTIDSRLVPFYTELNNLRDKYFGLLKEVIEVNLEGTWTVVALHDDSMRIGFIRDYWDEEKTRPNYQDFDLYFGCPWYNNKDERFQINTCCFGSFDILNDNIARTYYIGVGKLLSDEKLANNIHTLCMEYYNKRIEVEKAMKPIEDEIADEKRAASEAAKKKENAEVLAKLKTKLADPKNTYALIFKGGSEENHFIYRKQPVRLIELYDNYTDAVRGAKGFYTPFNGKYAVVDSYRLKEIA